MGRKTWKTNKKNWKCNIRVKTFICLYNLRKSGFVCRGGCFKVHINFCRAYVFPRLQCLQYSLCKQRSLYIEGSFSYQRTLLGELFWNEFLNSEHSQSINKTYKLFSQPSYNLALLQHRGGPTSSTISTGARSLSWRPMDPMNNHIFYDLHLNATWGRVLITVVHCINVISTSASCIPFCL